jgi:putative acetyltransferase
VTELDISIDDPMSSDVAQLLGDHLAFAQKWSSPDEVHVLDAERLASDAVLFFSARMVGRLLAVGALRTLNETHVEIKSMHTADEARGQGVGQAMLEYLLAAARGQGFARVSLETGQGDAFAPARSLYRRSGFEICPPFGYYRISADSVCMTLGLSAPSLSSTQ